MANRLKNKQVLNRDQTQGQNKEVNKETLMIEFVTSK